MAKKKIIKKVKKVEEPLAKEVKEEVVEAFDMDEAPEGEETELSELEQEISDEESEFEEEIQEERFYVVPLAKGFRKGPKWNASKKAMKTLQEFLRRHMKPEGEVFVSMELNQRVWENGIKNPPRRVRIRVTKSVDGIVRAYLA
ncbi:MAG: 50S ribosomal protein L31e [Promethearchaeota archaeon]